MTISYRTIWIALVLFGLVFILTQSYIALPRPMIEFLIDSLLPILIVASLITIIINNRNQLLLYTGVVYAILTLVTLVTDIFAKEYGTFFFLFLVYLLVDWINEHRYHQSLTSQLRKNRSTIAVSIVSSTFVFGLITEYVNLPFMIWSYNIPIPSLSTFGIPALIAAFGWTPWTLSILAIFFHFILHPTSSKSKSSTQ